MESDRTPSAAASTSPKFAVRIKRGLVTHVGDVPLTTWEQADKLRQDIFDGLGERGEIEEVRLSAKP